MLNVDEISELANRTRVALKPFNRARADAKTAGERVEIDVLITEKKHQWWVAVRDTFAQDKKLSDQKHDAESIKNYRRLVNG
jgi:phage terminase large subunit-like protein